MFWLLVLVGLAVILLFWRTKGGALQKIMRNGALLILALVITTPFLLYFLLGGNPIIDLSAERFSIGDSETHYYRYGDEIFYMNQGNITVDRRYLEDVDANSFELLDYHWAKDKNSVYYTYQKTPFSPETFSLLGCHYFSDGKNVYYGATVGAFILNLEQPLKQRLNVMSNDAENFEIVLEGAIHCTAKDTSYVYQNYDVVNGADPASFRFLNNSWAVDKNQVFVRGGTKLNSVPDIDPSSLVPVGGAFVTDNRTVYSASNWTSPYYIDLAADPDTFVAERTFDEIEYWDAKDKDFYYKTSGQKKSMQ